MASLKSKRLAHKLFDRQSDLPSPSNNTGACAGISRYLSKSVDNYKENGLLIHYTDLHVNSSVCLLPAVSIITPISVQILIRFGSLDPVATFTTTERRTHPSSEE